MLSRAKFFAQTLVDPFLSVANVVQHLIRPSPPAPQGIVSTCNDELTENMKDICNSCLKGLHSKAQESPPRNLRGPPDLVPSKRSLKMCVEICLWTYTHLTRSVPKETKRSLFF